MTRMTQLCECDSFNCTEGLVASIEQLMMLRTDPRVVLISKACQHTPEPPGELVDEGETFFAYRVVESATGVGRQLPPAFPEDVWVAFHKVWTFCVRKPGYDKKFFIDLERELLRMHREAPEEK